MTRLYEVSQKPDEIDSFIHFALTTSAKGVRKDYLQNLINSKVIVTKVTLLQMERSKKGF